MAKVKYFYKSKCDESEKSLFVTSNGWLNNFMHRNGFSLYCKTITTQQDPDRLVHKLILCLLHAHSFQLNMNTLLPV